MIVVKMYGNIGEQLFKYAAARNFALIYKTSVLIDISWFLKNKKAKQEPNKIAIESFNTEYGMAGTVIINNFIKSKQKHYINRFPETAKYKVINEIKGEYTNAPFQTNPPFFLNGDFKSEKYFEENIFQIKEDLTIKITSNKKLLPLIKRIETVNSIAVYIETKHTNKNNIETKLNINWDYYNKAIEYFESKILNPHFVLFTDLEQDEVEQLKIKDSKEIIKLFVSEQEWKNIYLMSACNYFIANDSATAWWASWLNFTNNRTVLIPENFSYEYPEITHNKLGIQQNWIKL